MKAIESYGKDSVAGCRGTLPVFLFLAISDFPSELCNFFIRPNERARKILRVHYLNLFHNRRSLHLIFLDSSCTGGTIKILTLCILSATTI